MQSRSSADMTSKNIQSMPAIPGAVTTSHNKNILVYRFPEGHIKK